MLQSKNKISLNQLLLINIAVEFTPFVRLSGGFIAEDARQAGWISGIIAIIPITLLFYIISKLYKNNKDASFMDIINNSMGSVVGRIIIVLYFIWITLLLALYIRYYAERLVTTLMPRTSMSFIIISMLVIVILALRSGITVIARMNEIIVAALVFALVLILIFGVGLVDIEKITPISYLDILPAFAGSTVLWALMGYIIILFFFGDQVNDKEHIFKYGMYNSIFLVAINTLLLVYIIGGLGWSVAARLPYATFTMVRKISLFGVVERIESLLVGLWVLSDFILISVFAYVLLRIIKHLFKLSTYKPLVLPFIIWIYFLSLLIAENVFELEKSSEKIFVPANLFFEYVIPLLILIVGKIRKKV